MQRISVFDMMKIGVGPSSSHTMGPWQAARRFLAEPGVADALQDVSRVRVDLFGSLAKTGRGHGTDIAVLLGLSGEDPETIEPELITIKVDDIRQRNELVLLGRHSVVFDENRDLVFHFDETLPAHPNGMRFTAFLCSGAELEAVYYSIGGGFVVREDESPSASSIQLPYPCDNAEDLLGHCRRHNLHIWEMVWANELQWRSAETVRTELMRLWNTMADCIFRGCHQDGILPGGLRVVRRASAIQRRLIGQPNYFNRAEWIARIQERERSFQDMVKWVSCFALAVNEENASFGRVVTAPTNGAAGVIPAVLMHYVCFHRASDEDIMRFLLVAGEIASFFKKGATISAALGGCQAEIGVSSAMAAAALAECLGASVSQALMAAEIAMEHHLGLTCDPIAGLVQVPCIERNAMGAMKAITAAHLALESSPEFAKVSLDAVIKTMWDTAQDMSSKYKETAEGGLAVNIPVNVIEC